MTARLKVFTRHFRQLDEFTLFDLQNRNWLINGVGQANFRIGLSDSQCTKRNLHVSNMFIIESDIAPLWCGRADRVAWQDPDSVTVTCNSREALLKGVPYDQKVTRTDDLVELINKARSDPHILLDGIIPGKIHSATLSEDQSVSETGDILTVAKDLADLLEYEFWVDHKTGAFNMQPRAGRDVSHNVTIGEEDIIASPTFAVDIQDVLWGAESVGPGTKENELRRGFYIDEQIREFVEGDVRERIVHAYQTVSDSKLHEDAKTLVYKSLKSIFKMDVSINNTRNITNKFFLGDTIGLHLPTVGFGLVQKMRVIGIEMVNEDSPQMRLVLDAVNPRGWFKQFNPSSNS